jgi:hypothetical protein
MTAGMVWPTRTAAKNPMHAHPSTPVPCAGAPFAAKAVVVVAAVTIKVVIATVMTDLLFYHHIAVQLT